MKLGQNKQTKTLNAAFQVWREGNNPLQTEYPAPHELRTNYCSSPNEAVQTFSSSFKHW